MGALTALSVAAWVSAIAGAGSGTAIITPSAPVAAGSTGKWSIQYTAAETIKNGRVRITVPAGFGAPQSSSSSSPGYVTVSSNEPTGSPLLSIGGQVITIDVDTLTVGNTLTIVYGDDTVDSGARASAATTTGSYTFVVASDPSGSNPSPIASSPSLTVIADTPDHIEIAPSDTSVVAGTFAPYRLIVRDQYGNRAPVASTRTVQLFPASGSFYTTPGHSPISSTTIASGKTSVRIDYSGTTASNGTAHSIFVFTPSGSPALAGSDDVNVIAAALSTTQSTISATSPVVADGSLSSVTVTSKDAFGNPRGGDTVVLGVTGSALKTDPSGATDAAGVAVGAVSNTVAQLVTVSATINGQAITATTPITFVAGPVSAATSTVDATTPVVANGAALSTVTVTARDANGNPVAGQSVTLSVLPAPSSVLTQPGGVTNGAGVTTGTLSATTVGARTVSAQIGATAITDNAVVNFTPGPIADFTWIVDGAATAGVAESVTLTAKDAQGNTVTNFTGTVNLSTNTSGSGDPVQWGPGTGLGTLNNVAGTDQATYTFAAGDNGVATLQVTDTHAESLQLTAVSGVANQTSLNIVVAHNVADAVQLVAGDAQSATVNTNVATAPLVKVVDAYGNAVGGATVTFTVLSGGGSRDVVSGGGVDAAGISGADGTIDCDVWTLGTQVSANPNQLRAQIVSGTTPQVTFTATATAGSGTQLAITPTSQNVTVGSSTTLTATLLDAFNNPKSGVRIDMLIKGTPNGTLAANGGDPNPTTFITSTSRYGTSDANGQISVLYQAPAGSGLSDVVDAFTSTVAQGSVADRTYTTVASGATSYRITFVGPASAAAGASFHFKVEAVDGGGNIDTSNSSTATLAPEVGSNLTFSLTDFGATTFSVPLINGARDVYGRGTLVGNWDINVTGTLGPTLKAVDITPGTLDHYTLAPIGTPVAAGANFNVSVSARDQYENLVTGAGNSITLAAWDDVNNNAALANLSVTGAALVSGQVTVGEAYIKAEAIRVRVSDTNGKVGISSVVTVTDAGANHIAKVSGDANNVIAGAGQVLVVQVLDQYENPVVGATVNFVKLTGGGSIPASAVTNAGGNAQQTLTTGTTVGANTVKATILDENPPAAERVDFSVTTVAGALDNYLVSPSKTNPVAHEDVTLTISGRDANNNVRVLDSTTIVALSKGASSAVLTSAGGPLINGVFTTTVHDDTAESFTVTATTGGVSDPSPAIVVSNAPADNVTKVSGDASGVTAGGTQPLTVVVRDPYNNPVPNQVVTFSIATAPDGTAFIVDPTGDTSDGITVTDGTGQASVNYHTAVTVGANTINAQILDASPPNKEKVTFTVNTAASGATKLVFSFIGSSTVAAGQNFQFKVEAKDASNNLVTSNNSAITLTPEAGSTLLFSLASDLSNPNTTFNLVNGTRTFYGRGTKAGQWDITADASGLTSDTDQVTVTDTGVIASYLVSAPANAPAGAAFIVNLEARDQYANRVMSANNVVNLNAVDDVATTPTGIAFGVTQATLVAGAVVVNETYTKADAIRVHASAGGFEGYSSPITITPGNAYRVANQGGNSNSVIAGQQRTLTARVFDQYDNVVTGQLVSFAVVGGGGGSVLPTSGTTNASGDVTTSLTTGTIVGTNTARATILDGNPAALETADFTVGTVAGNIADYEVTTAKTALVANEATGVTIKARDQFGNYRIGDNTTNITVAPSGSATLGNTTGTLTNGQFVTTVSDTVAQNFTVTAQTQGSPAQAGTSPPVTVTNGPAYRIVYVSGSSSSVPVGFVQPLRAEVRDQWGNTVANQTVRYLLQSSPPGGFVADAVSDTTDGITTSVANGRSVARLHTSNTAGAAAVTATILDGSPAGLERVTFNVTTQAGAIAKYTVQMSSNVGANAANGVTVTAYDLSNNPVDNDVQQVTLTAESGTGLVFLPNPITLSNGVGTANVTTTLAQTYQVRASSVGNPSVTGLGPVVTVAPGSPNGANSITASPTLNPITANGTSQTTITSSIIRDQWGNQVAAGENINVTANNGGQIVGGSPKQVGADGRIQFDLKSSTSVGACTVTMASVSGNATGSIIVNFAAKPSVAFSTPATPPVVVPGTNVAFQVQATNSSATSVSLNTSTTLSFSDGARTFSANLAAAQTIPGNGGVTLAFTSAALSAAFLPGQYTPQVTLVGSDQYSSPVNTALLLPAGSLLVTSIEITGIVPASGIVSRGKNTTIAVTVKNNGSQPAVINDVDVVFTPSDLFTVGNAPENGTSVPAGASQTFNVPVTVQAGATPQTYQVDASASGTVSGQSVVDNSVAPHPFASVQVTAAASLAYVSSTLSPTSVSSGRSYAFQLTLQNTGGGLVSIDSSTTRLTFTDGAHAYTVAPVQPYAIPGGGATQVLTFNSRYVNAAFIPGPYNVTLHVDGLENSASFTQDVALTGSPVTVQTPAAIVPASIDAVKPDQVSKTTTATFIVTLQNNGGATVVLNPATTTIKFASNQFSATLNPTGPVTLAPGSTPLQFNGAVVAGTIAMGNYAPTVQLTGTENGDPFNQTVTFGAETVNVQNPPAIAILNLLPSQPQFTVDQAKRIQVRMIVANTSAGAGANFSSASLRFIHAGIDRTNQFQVTMRPPAFRGGALLSPSEVDTVLFDVADNTGNPMSAGNMTIEGALVVNDVNTSQPINVNTDLGGKGNLQVMTPAAITFDAVTVSQAKVTAGMSKTFQVHATVHNTGGSDVVLNLGSGFTQLNFAPSPGWVWTAQPTLVGGGTTLSGGEIDEIVFNVTTTGSTPGPTGINVVTSGTEINSLRPVGNTSLPASVLVQTPANIQVTSVVPSRTTITSGSNVNWTVTATLTNTGQSDVDLALGNAVLLNAAGATVPPLFTAASTLTGGGITLSGGETDQVVLSLTTAGTYPVSGATAFTVTVNGTEQNSGATRGNNGSTNVTVQKTPVLNFVSLTPGTVSKLTTVSFQVAVTNPTANGATITLDRALTRLRFGANQFNAGLSGGSPVDVPSGAQVSLQFTGTVVAAGIPAGVQADAVLDLVWTQNGVPDNSSVNLSTQITVQNAPSLQIASVRTSRSSMTRSQNNAGTVTMVLTNSGGAPIDLDLSPATTHLGFKVLSSGAAVTGEYAVQAPAGFEAAGGTLLAGGATDSLVFNIAQAGTTTGTIIVNGYAGGIDQNSQLPISDDTFDGGNGSFSLQLPGALSILSITPSQATATVGQTGPYTVLMAVKNTGGAAIDVDLSPANSSLQFANPSGWSVNAATMAGGVTLSGGETDELSFLVTGTGGPAGITSIAGAVGGIEKNTGALRTDDTASGGTGSIMLQTPANLIVDSVKPSQPSITAPNSVAWDATIKLHNAGQSDARLDLPAGFTISIQSAGAGTTIVRPVDLEEGGVVLAGGASGTLVAHTTVTDTFSTLGQRSLNVFVGATELNSNRAFSVPGTGSVVVQTAPNLVVTAIRPAVVTSQSVVDFEVDVENPGANAATVHFNRATTRARFASNAFSAVLDVSSPDSIVSGATVTLHFEAKPVSSSIALGPYDFDVDLNYTANNVAVSEPEVVAGGVTIQAAPQLSIQSIVASQPTVTAGQGADWTATMTVVNNGSANIALHLNSPNTKLTFIAPGGAPDNSYQVSTPIMVGGNTTLLPTQTGQLQFTVTQTGTAPGNVVISGKVEGTDQAQLIDIVDDTFDGGRGGIVVQTPAVVSVVAVRPTQPKVTETQNGWSVRVVLANTGGSDVAINIPGTNPAFNPPTNWLYNNTQPLAGGGNVLEGGAVDSLLIPIIKTGNPATTRIDASVPWTEMNSARTGTFNTATSGGFGQVLVQSKPDLRVLATTSASPNPAAVDLNQSFNVQVTVENRGGADASNVVIGLGTDGSSSILSAAPMPSVPGGQQVSYLLPVQAAGAPNAQETFTSSITSAIDQNSGQGTLVNYSPAVDKTAALAVQSPATADVIRVRPSQASVTRGQANPWSVTVAVHNAGQAGVNLAPPAAGDLDFSIAGATKIDYVVQAPTRFASGAAGWTLAGGATDSLTYSIVSTGNDTGTLDVAAKVAGSDRNDPPRTVNGAGATTVTVQDVAGLFIASTFPVGTFNHVSPGRDIVNTNFAYEIHVTVQNAGGEDVDSVKVQLTTDGASTIAPATKKGLSIAAAGSHEFVFRVTSPAAPVDLETFESKILAGVISHNTQQPVIPQPPLDDTHLVQAQRRADLNLNLFVASPPGSAGGVVGTNQVFTLAAKVTNLGDAALANTGTVTLTVPGNFNPPVEALARSFAAGDTVRWSFTAPGSVQAASNFSCTIAPIPNDVNTGAVAFVSKQTDTQSITVTSGGALANPDVSLTAPAGAADDTLSVGQQFTLHAAVAANHVKSLVATLSLPGGFSVIGGTGSVQNVPNGPSPRSVNYTVAAPALPSVSSDLFVTFTALDSITGDPVPSAADTVKVTTVPRTSLSISAGVIAPPDAVDKKVAIAEQFTVSATVANAAGAAGIAAAGNLTINLPPGYTRVANDPQVKPFVIGAPVQWNLMAASQPSGPDQIAITISSVPLDENSGLAAQVASGTANIAMVTEGSAVSVRDVSSAQNVGTPVAPGGAANLDVMAFEIAYNVTDTSVPPAQVDTVAVTIIDKSGTPLGPNTVAQTLKRVALDLGGSNVFEVTNPSTNPVLVSLRSAGKGFEIDPNASANAIVRLDLDQSPKATELRVNIRGAGMVVKDPNSGRLGVTNAQGQVLDIKSGPLVVLSSNFQEYAHNYPNPFSAGGEETKIAYFLDAPANVSIKIYSITGDLVHEESIPSGDPRAQAGPRETTWDGRNDKGEVVRNGVYVCVLNAGGKSAKFRIAVAK